VQHASDRLRLSGEHTVVALVGATGSGKSSLFNALARMELSTVGVRRPTTAEAFACVWGPVGAGPLLDWLDIAPERRFARESALDADDEAHLRGLLLLDLPDFDSVAARHRVIVDRLLALVDLVVWVTDPQKYADQAIHEGYLRTFGQHRNVTMAVLNQADRLRPADAERCVADLARLLAADGLPGVPVFAVSATTHVPGNTQLREALAAAVQARQAALHRLTADLDEVGAELVELAWPMAGPESIDPDQAALLADALAATAGVPAITAAAVESYRLRTHRARWLGPVPRRDPVDEVLATEPTAGQAAAMGLAVRTFTEPLAQRLPAPWAGALAEAARARLAELPDALRQVISDTDLGIRPAAGWRLLGLLRWLAGLALVAGAGWVAGRSGPGEGAGWEVVRRMPVLVIPGVVVGALLLLALLGTPLPGMLARIGARAARRRADGRLRAAVTELTQEYVVRPVRQVLERYAQARAAIRP
jgi:GTP-binding protein EngB required for normal cell division